MAPESAKDMICLASADIGGAEIIVILIMLLVLGTIALGLAGLVYLIVRATMNNRPASKPSEPLSEAAIQEQQRRDREHLRLLAIFHFIFGGFAVLGIGFLCVHYAFLHAIFSNPDMWKSQNQPMPPKAFLDLFIWIYLFAGALLVTGGVLNVLSGNFILKTKNRLFSQIIAGLNCFQFPFGTALGVLTILVLSRESVHRLYSGSE